MTDRHRQVIDEFRASHGKPGGFLAGLTLLLATTGARSGHRRTTALTYQPAPSASIFPRLDIPDRPDNSMAAAERWAAGIDSPAYAIDAQTAIKVADGAVEVVSEGQWRLFNSTP